MRRVIQYTAQAVAALSLSLAATGSMADIVINDDLIVVGNTCLGQDCINGMAFNGNELILRENNTRVAFGSDGQFRLAANSSVNGGANEFRIDGIEPPTNFTAPNATTFGGIAVLPSATVLGDGSLLVSLDELTAITLDGTDFSDATIEITPGQQVTIPAGSYTAISGTFYSIDAGVTVTTATNSISATVTGNAENRVAFSADGNMVTLGRGAEDVAGAVSVGSALSLRRVTGVADAVATDDIINVRQLNAALGAPTSALPNAIEAENDRLNGVSAMTAAMSALQLNPRRQGQLSLSMGLGFYEGETAGALGLSLRASEFSHVQFSIAGSDQTSSQTAVSFNFAW